MFVSCLFELAKIAYLFLFFDSRESCPNQFLPIKVNLCVVKYSFLMIVRVGRLKRGKTTISFIPRCDRSKSLKSFSSSWHFRQ